MYRLANCFPKRSRNRLVDSLIADGLTPLACLTLQSGSQIGANCAVCGLVRLLIALFNHPLRVQTPKDLLLGRSLVSRGQRLNELVT